MSDTAPACPRCGWARAALLAAEAKAGQNAAGAKLVALSTKLMLLGFVLMLGGCGVGIGLRAGPEAIVAGVVLGLVVLVVAAVIGQVGRAKQGRII